MAGKKYEWQEINDTLQARVLETYLEKEEIKVSLEVKQIGESQHSLYEIDRSVEQIISLITILDDSDFNELKDNFQLEDDLEEVFTLSINLLTALKDYKQDVSEFFKKHKIIKDKRLQSIKSDDIKPEKRTSWTSKLLRRFSNPNLKEKEKEKVKQNSTQLPVKIVDSEVMPPLIRSKTELNLDDVLPRNKSIISKLLPVNMTRSASDQAQPEEIEKPKLIKSKSMLSIKGKLSRSKSFRDIKKKTSVKESNVANLRILLNGDEIQWIVNKDMEYEKLIRGIKNRILLNSIKLDNLSDIEFCFELEETVFILDESNYQGLLSLDEPTLKLKEEEIQTIDSNDGTTVLNDTDDYNFIDFNGSNIKKKDGIAKHKTFANMSEYLETPLQAEFKKIMKKDLWDKDVSLNLYNEEKAPPKPKLKKSHTTYSHINHNRLVIREERTAKIMLNHMLHLEIKINIYHSTLKGILNDCIVNFSQHGVPLRRLKHMILIFINPMNKSDPFMAVQDEKQLQWIFKQNFNTLSFLLAPNTFINHSEYRNGVRWDQHPNLVQLI
ncbi:hypothetical protein K502DRAFT_325785 [Neoconidiobolus thromboides FSU 785]|nr:hypothetical protein K502DRAFT_325785 [Neoconidiobolus thromboides FSU 785]